MSFLVSRVLKNLASKYTGECSKSFQRNYPAPRKRFYKSVLVTESDGKYEINLDKRKLKTPLGKPLQVPNEALATVVANEWDMQNEILQQQNMHLTSLCNTALDNPCQQSKDSLVDSILEFLVADTLCYRSREPEDFLTLQEKQWNPLLEWFEQRYHVKVNVAEDINTLPVPQETISQLRKYLISFSSWSLLGIKFAAESLKSLILTLAITNRVIDVDAAVKLSRLETNFQTEHWGKVEWSHDVEETQTTSRVAAATLFIILNESSTTFTKKNSIQKDLFRKDPK